MIKEAGIWYWLHFRYIWFEFMYHIVLKATFLQIIVSNLRPLLIFIRRAGTSSALLDAHK